MVTINLLEKEKLRKRRQKALLGPAKKSNIRFLAYTLMILAVALTAYIHWDSKNKLEEASTRRNELREQSDQLTTIQEEVGKFEETKNLALERITAIEELQKQQRDPVKLMNSLASGVSSGSKIWLTKLTKEGSFVSMQGRALDVPAIADLIEALESTPPFSSVEINYWEKEESGKSLEFDLRCEIRETQAETEDKKEGEK